MGLRDYLANLPPQETEQAFQEGFAQRLTAEPQPLPVRQVTPPEELADRMKPSLAYWQKFARSAARG